MSIDDLIKTAIEMRTKAIVPYSGYKVGAAVQTNTGKIIGGCNIENSSYSLTCCAERVALFRAIAEGFTKFKALSVSTKNTGMPCGACRQRIREFASLNTPIHMCSVVKHLKTTSLEE